MPARTTTRTRARTANRRFTACSLLALALGSCEARVPIGGDAGPDSTVVDGAVVDVPSSDGGSQESGSPMPRTVAELDIARSEQLAGLDGDVDVVVDRYGWPHIYAHSLRDVSFAEGYWQARDRMPQMELLRRKASGTLAEAFGPLAPSLLDEDIVIRAIGLRRAAEASWAATPAGRARDAIEAFARGVNTYLDALRAGRVRTPNGTELVVNEETPPWTPVDTLVIGRIQALSQSYLADEELRATELRERVRERFESADPMSAAERFARRGFFWDFFRFEAASPDAIAVPDFLARMPARQEYRPPVLAPRIGSAVLARARSSAEVLTRALAPLGGPHRGSNNFVVFGGATASGHAILENDPHMSLPSPALLWGTHLVVRDGADAMDVAGVALPGAPGVLFGYSRRVAWGMTNSFIDSIDVYEETITPGTNGGPATVRFQGREVPVQIVTERVPDGSGNIVEAQIEVVPHHGPILPEVRGGRIVPRTGNRAISVRWVGHQATDEVGAIVGLMYARNVSEARQALRTFGTPPLSWVLADVEGNVAFHAQAIIPRRSPGARTLDPSSNPMGTAPCLVLPGDGTAEWTDTLTPEQLPHADGSMSRPFIVTANNDLVGVTRDNNPLNDGEYYGCKWAFGFRAQRITEQLQALSPRITREQAQHVVDDVTVVAGGRLRPFLAAALARLEQEWATPGTHADLRAVGDATRPRAARVRDAVSRVMGWSLRGAAGLDGASEADVRDSIATTIFHGWLVKLLDGLFADELASLEFGLGGYVTDQVRLGSALFLLEHPEAARTRDAESGQSVVWDDMRTAGVRESRDHVLLSSFDAALTELARVTSTDDVTRWRWGALHTIRFESMVPGPGTVLTIPRANDAMFPRGFPRAGGLDVPDASDPGTSDFDFSYRDGPAQRFTVEMDPAGPRGFNALPGGNVWNTSSPFFRNEAELWRTNNPHEIPRAELDVVTAASQRVRLTRAR